MAVIRGVVFDLDDTLYLESDFVRSGFQSVSRYLSGSQDPNLEAQLFNYLWGLFESGVRGNTFNRLFDAHPALAARHKTEDLVKVYRAHVPDIQFLPGALELIELLSSQGYNVGLISDGPLLSQAAKVKALGLSGRMDPVVLTDHWGRKFWKPHVRGFKYISAVWGLPPEFLVYVGDNPEKDFVTPRRLGWHTVRLRIPGQQRFDLQSPNEEFTPHEDISSLSDIITVLLRLRNDN